MRFRHIVYLNIDRGTKGERHNVVSNLQILWIDFYYDISKLTIVTQCFKEIITF